VTGAEVVGVIVGVIVPEMVAVFVDDCDAVCDADKPRESDAVAV
jgi:hypothetical protein